MADKIQIPFQDLRRMDPGLLAEIEQAASDVIRSGWYIGGANVKAFEKELAEACGASHSVATSTGLDALRLILRAYVEMGRLRPGDEVIVPANTFIATFLAVSDAGLRPVVAEPDPTTFGLDFTRLPLSAATRAIITVHLYGTPAWNLPVLQRLHDDGILVIEDNAQAIGALAATPGFHGSRSTGSLGDAAGISFYPAKNIGALGDAGAVTTCDPLLDRTVRELANYGGLEKYSHRLRGYNCRLDEIQAAILRVKLRRLGEVSERRRAIAAVYTSAISNPLVAKPAVFADMKQVWHQYVIRTPQRDALRTYLLDHGIGTEIHYPVPAHMQPCYAGALGGPYPTAESLASGILSLPIAETTEAEALTVAETINAFSPSHI